MEIKNIIENGHLVEVKVYQQEEVKCKCKTLIDVKTWFNKQKEDGYIFLKSFKENEKIQTLFIKEKDFNRLLS